MGRLVDAAIPFFVGIYCLLVGFRLVGSKPGTNPKYDQFHAQYGLVFKLIGVGLILLSVFYLTIRSGGR
jgi:hypothetical protein